MTEESITGRDVILKKMHRKKLTEEEINLVVKGVISGELKEIEITTWLAAMYLNKMDDEEIVAYTKALVNTGSVVKFKEKEIYDFHSIGGISGNKITPIIVSMVSAAGLTIPKTSTHAISSACGTVDFVETFCNTKFNKDELPVMAEKTKGLFVMGGFADHCPADDIIIKVEHLLSINPCEQMFPSILGKKLGMSVSHLLVEIPMGPTAKLRTIAEAKFIADGFVSVGKKLGMEVKIAISDANQPVGYSIGPILEARECISALQHPEAAPPDIVDKVLKYTATILSMSGIENPRQMSSYLLFSGKAYEKFKEIVKIQGGNPDVQPEDLELGKYKVTYESPKEGYISSMDNWGLIHVAKTAGAPTVKVAGIRLFKKIGDYVKKGDVLMEIYSSSQEKADEALKVTHEFNPYGFSMDPVRKIAENVVIDIM